MRAQIILALCVTSLFCGCASGEKKTQAKKIHERAWIGGSFERVKTPTALGTNTHQFAGHALLVTRVQAETPLANAGVTEGDLLLTANEKNIRFQRDFENVIDRAGTSPIPIKIYRAGEITETSITPGLERYQILHHIGFGIPLATHFDVDLYPNPDFSLVALGYDSRGKRLDLRDAVSKYRTDQGEYYRDHKDGWQGLGSAEGWRTWLGPFMYSENKLIISQEPSR